MELLIKYIGGALGIIILFMLSQLVNFIKWLTGRFYRYPPHKIKTAQETLESKYSSAASKADAEFYLNEAAFYNTRSILNSTPLSRHWIAFLEKEGVIKPFEVKKTHDNFIFHENKFIGVYWQWSVYILATFTVFVLICATFLHFAYKVPGSQIVAYYITLGLYVAFTLFIFCELIKNGDLRGIDKRIQSYVEVQLTRKGKRRLYFSRKIRDCDIINAKD